MIILRPLQNVLRIYFCGVYVVLRAPDLDRFLADFERARFDFGFDFDDDRERRLVLYFLCFAPPKLGVSNGFVEGVGLPAPPAGCAFVSISRSPAFKPSEISFSAL